MFPLPFCNPWAQNQNQVQLSDDERSLGSTSNRSSKDIFSAAKPVASTSRLSSSIRDIRKEMGDVFDSIRADMKKAGAGASMPAISLNDSTRKLLVRAESEFGSMSLSDLAEDIPLENTDSPRTASQDQTPPQELKALRKILQDIKLLDFPLTKSDTFLVIQMLQRQDALSPNDLRDIFDAFGRQSVALSDFAQSVAELINTPDLPDALMFEAANGFIKTVDKQNISKPQMDRNLAALCAQLTPAVRAKMKDYLVEYKMPNPASILMSLKKPSTQRPAELASMAQQTAVKQQGSQPIRRPIRKAGGMSQMVKTVPFSAFYPKTGATKVKLDY